MTRASQEPPQRRGALRGPLTRPVPDLRVLGRLRAVQGPFIGEELGKSCRLAVPSTLNSLKNLVTPAGFEPALPP